MKGRDRKIWWPWPDADDTVVVLLAAGFAAMMCGAGLMAAFSAWNGQ